MKPWIIERLLKTLNLFLAGMICLGVVMLVKEWISPNPLQNVSIPKLNLPQSSLVHEADDLMVLKGPLLGQAKIQEVGVPSIKVRGIASAGSKLFAVVEMEGIQSLIHEGAILGEWIVQKISQHGVSLRHSGGNKIEISPEIATIKTYTIQKEETGQQNIEQTPLELDEAMVRNVLSHWADIFREARFFPYVEDGVTLGYVILDIHPNSLIQKLGLRIGDIVERINGESITDLGALLTIYDHLEGGELRVDVKRGPRMLQLVYQIGRDKKFGVQSAEFGVEKG